MCTVDVVQANVQAALEAVGSVSSAGAKAEAKALEEVTRILAPIKDVTWPSGRPENSI
jgi:hypothetical protein